MKKIIMILAFASALPLALNAQKFITKNGQISFVSVAPLETIEAHNDQVNASLDMASGDFNVKVLMQSFEFKKSLMQEHFNDNYVESDKYPNSSFVGKITNIRDLDTTKDGTVTVQVKGNLTIHGVTKSIDAVGSFQVTEGTLVGTSKFTITLSDYNIAIPMVSSGNISKTIDITVKFTLTKLS